MRSARSYQFKRSLGRGGMAEVYLAIAQGEGGFERTVAVKRILPGADDPSLRRMFLDEARIASTLHHENIVSVLDFGLSEDQPFQVLEYVDGADLSKLRQQVEESGQRFPLEFALYVCLEVAHALAYVHESGGDGRGAVVHRDVKPSNILVAWTGHVKLADFGIALAQGRLERTQPGMIKGTFSYASPEQIAGRQVDGRTDLYALGRVLERLLTSGEPEDGGGLPADVAGIIGRATEGDLKKRYAVAASMAADLGRALASRLDQNPKLLFARWLRTFSAADPRNSARADELLGVNLVRSAPDDHSWKLVSATEELTQPGQAQSEPMALEVPRRSRSGTKRRAWQGATLGLLGLATAAVAGAILGLRAQQALPAAAPASVLAAEPEPTPVPVPAPRTSVGGVLQISAPFRNVRVRVEGEVLRPGVDGSLPKVRFETDGERVVEATAPGRMPITTRVMVRDGETVTLPLVLRERPRSGVRPRPAGARSPPTATPPDDGLLDPYQ